MKKLLIHLLSCLLVFVSFTAFGAGSASIRDGKILVNGKPTVLLGWYGGTGWIVSKACLERYPTAADKCPCNFPDWINLEVPRLIPQDADLEAREMTQDAKPSQAVYDAVRKAIEANRNSEAFVYYLSDEPECRKVSPVYLKYLYQFIRQQDPTRLVMIISREPQRYLECADILSPHHYIDPVIDDAGNRYLMTTVEKLRNCCKDFGALHRADKALMLTPQVHSYAFNSTNSVYPNYDESRASCWCCFVNGGQGLYPYIYYEHFSRPDLELGFTEIYETAQRLEPWIACGQFQKLSVENGDGALFVREDGARLVALVNFQPTVQKITASGIPAGEYFRFREEGKITVSAEGVSVELAPYQVLLLTSVKADDGLENLAALRERIATAETARCNRGNTLFGKGRQITVSYPESRPYTTQEAMEQQDKLFDGNTFVSAWMPRGIQGDLWYEMSFPAFKAEFTKVRIFGNALEGTVLKIWKKRKWVEPEATRSQDKYSLELDFNEPISTVKIRLEFPKSDALELYEFEALK